MAKLTDHEKIGMDLAEHASNRAAEVVHAFREGIQYATNCKVTDIDLAWGTSAARARALSDTP